MQQMSTALTTKHSPVRVIIHYHYIVPIAYSMSPYSTTLSYSENGLTARMGTRILAPSSSTPILFLSMYFSNAPSVFT